MPGARGLPHDRVAQVLFPFRLTLEDGAGAYLSGDLRPSGWSALIGIAVSLLVVLGLAHRRRAGWRVAWPNVVLVVATGLFGLLAVLLVPGPREDNHTGRR